MESCLSVERDLEKVLTKFSGVQEHTLNTIDDFISSIENLRKELAEGIVTFLFLAHRRFKNRIRIFCRLCLQSFIYVEVHMDITDIVRRKQISENFIFGFIL